MTENDRTRFASCLVAMAENFGKSPSKELSRLWFETFKQYSIEDFEKAVHTVLLSRKYTSMPTIADVVECLGGGSAADKAEIQASEVYNAVTSKGAYYNVVFDDPVTMFVIERSFGGWVELCSNLKAGEINWFIKEFVSHYKAAHNLGYKQFGVLEGIHGNAGGKTHVALFGNKEKAKQVMLSERVDRGATMLTGDIVQQLMDQAEKKMLT